VEFIAIIERRTAHRFVHIPALDTCGELPHADEPLPFATALVAAATGLPGADIQVSLLHAALGETVVSMAPVDVEVRHADGAWHAARQTGWLRRWHGSWGPLVAYTVDGITWTRGAQMSRVRRAHAEVADVPLPRHQRMSEPRPSA
jgi:hypothetical protein